MFHAPLRERPRRLAFKIQNDEIPFRAQHLAQMIIPVNAGPLPRAAQTIQSPELREQGAAPAQRQARCLHSIVGQSGKMRLQQIESVRGMARQLVAQSCQFARLEHVRCKSRLAARSKRQVHLRGTATQHCCSIQINTGVLTRLGRHNVRRGRRKGRWTPYRSCAFVITIQLIERPLPAVALVLYQPLEQGDRRRLAVSAPNFNRSAKRRNIRKLHRLG